MEYMSDSQLEKYQTITEKINKKFQESEGLKDELEKVKNRIILCNLACSDVRHQLTHVNVKIFSDIVDLFSLYGDFQCGIHEYAKCQNCNFCLIEIHFSKPLIHKLKDLQCYINIAIKFSGKTVGRSLNFTKKSPVLQIIPINKDIVDAKVETTLLVKLEDQWFHIKLEDISTDISYYFSVIKKKNKVKSLTENILQITELYNKDKGMDFNNLSLPVPVYSLPFCSDIAHFIASFLKNCYHNVDTQVISELANSTRNKIQFSTHNCDKEDHSITIKDGKLCIASSYPYLCSLKKYFIASLSQSFKVSNATAIVADLNKLNETFLRSPSDVKMIYSEAREFWSNSLI